LFFLLPTVNGNTLHRAQLIDMVNSTALAALLFRRGGPRCTFVTFEPCIVLIEC
jgi:hypothetical protein